MYEGDKEKYMQNLGDLFGIFVFKCDCKWIEREIIV